MFRTCVQRRVDGRRGHGLQQVAVLPVPLLEQAASRQRCRAAATGVLLKPSTCAAADDAESFPRHRVAHQAKRGGTCAAPIFVESNPAVGRSCPADQGLHVKIKSQKEQNTPAHGLGVLAALVSPGRAAAAARRRTVPRSDSRRVLLLLHSMAAEAPELCGHQPHSLERPLRSFFERPTIRSVSQNSVLLHD